MSNKPASINLLKNKQVSFFDKFINWALTIGRLVVILTELIALSAFLYRFSLDRRLIDLHAKIKQEQAVVNNLKNNEDRYRNLQERLELASNFSKLGVRKVKIIQDILNLAQKGVAFNNLVIYTNRISINANVQSTSALSVFTESLKNYPSISSVSLDSIETKPSSNLTVSITAILKKDKN